MNKIIIASGPVIVKNNEVLLDIQGDDNFWKFCGGRVHENESLSQTAIRRAKEELGINIEIVDNNPFLLHTTRTENGNTFDVVLSHFLANFSGDIITSDGVKEWKWHDVNNMPENLAPNILPTLKHFKIIK